MSEPTFNPDLPYGEVTGLPGVRYQQNGHSFNARHEYVSPEQQKGMERESPAERAIRVEAEKEALKELFKEEIRRGTTVTVIDKAPENPVFNSVPDFIGPGLLDSDPVEIPNFEELHWTQLRKMVEKIGKQYTGKLQAVETLTRHYNREANNG